MLKPGVWTQVCLCARDCGRGAELENPGVCSGARGADRGPRAGGVCHAHSLRLGGNVEPSTELTSPEHPGRRPYSRSYRMFPLNLTFQQNREVLFASAEVPGQLRAGPKPRSGLSLHNQILSEPLHREGVITCNNANLPSSRKSAGVRARVMSAGAC